MLTTGIPVLLIFVLVEAPCLQGGVSGKSSQLGVLPREESDGGMLLRDFSSLLLELCSHQPDVPKGRENLRKRMDKRSESVPAAFSDSSLGPCAVWSITRPCGKEKQPELGHQRARRALLWSNPAAYSK